MPDEKLILVPAVNTFGTLRTPALPKPTLSDKVEPSASNWIVLLNPPVFITETPLPPVKFNWLSVSLIVIDSVEDPSKITELPALSVIDNVFGTLITSKLFPEPPPESLIVWLSVLVCIWLLPEICIPLPA